MEMQNVGVGTESLETNSKKVVKSTVENLGTNVDVVTSLNRLVTAKLTELTKEELEQLPVLPFRVVLNEKYNKVTAALVLFVKALELEPSIKKSSTAVKSSFINYQFFDTLRMMWGYDSNATSIVKNVPCRFRRSISINKDTGVEETWYLWEALLAPNYRISGIFSNGDVKNLKLRYLTNNFKLLVNEKTYVGNLSKVKIGDSLYVKNLPLSNIKSEEEEEDFSKELDFNLKEVVL